MSSLSSSGAGVIYFLVMIVLGPTLIAAIIAGSWTVRPGRGFWWKIPFTLLLLALLPVGLWIHLENQASWNLLICALSFPSFQAAECAALPLMWFHFQDILFIYTVPLILTVGYVIRWLRNGSMKQTLAEIRGR